jgi:hypothetical protein
MGSDDEVQLLISTTGGATWTSLNTWNATNQPNVNGTIYTEDLSSQTGIVQFAFWASDGIVNDPEDYDFHVGSFNIVEIISAITSEDNPESCAGNDGEASVVVNGGLAPYLYTWDTAAASQMTATATGLAAGTYDLTVTDALGSTITSSAVVSGGVLINDLTVSSTAASCMGGTDGSATAITTATVATYVWDAGAANQTTATATDLAAGTYNVLVTDVSGCTANAQATVADGIISCFDPCVDGYEAVNQLTGAQTTNAIYETDQGIDSDQVIDGAINVEYDAGIDIDLLPGFEVKLGVEFEAYIDGCNLPPIDNIDSIPTLKIMQGVEHNTFIEVFTLPTVHRGNDN